MPRSKKDRTSPSPRMRIHKSSGNVFRDLGFPEDEAINLLARSELMIQIKNIIEAKNLTQTKAAKLLGVGQPRISALYTGKIDDFTVDMLMKWLHKLGKEVVLTVRDKPKVA